jgi:hypothetical protein
VKGIDAMRKIFFLAFDLTLISAVATGCTGIPTPALTSTALATAVLPSATPQSPFNVVPSATFLPLESLSEIPSGEFLFVFLNDDDYSTCLDGLCACPVSEFPADSFKFVDDKLLLIKQDFEPMPEDWITFRKNSQASILYNYYGSQFAEFRLFSSVPVETPLGNFVIMGMNLRGEIQVQTKDEITILGVGSKVFSEEPEQKEEGCKILHKYSLTNYGLIRDEDVELVTGWS